MAFVVKWVIIKKIHVVIADFYHIAHHANEDLTNINKALHGATVIPHNK